MYNRFSSDFIFALFLPSFWLIPLLYFSSNSHTLYLPLLFSIYFRYLLSLWKTFFILFKWNSALKLWDYDDCNHKWFHVIVRSIIQFSLIFWNTFYFYVHLEWTAEEQIRHIFQYIIYELLLNEKEKKMFLAWPRRHQTEVKENFVFVTSQLQIQFFLVLLVNLI